MSTVFLLGATGYIGGDTLHALSNSSCDFKIRALVRDMEKGDQVKKAYSSVEIVHGTLDDLQLIEKEASTADVVIHLAATGHSKSSDAIVSGLGGRKSGYYIQISGATLLSQDEIKAKSFGEASEQVTSDVDGLQSLKDIIEKNPQRAVDNILLNASKKHPNVYTALVIGPIIYGQGRGPSNQRSIQIPELSRIALQRGRAVQIGKGLNRWGNVHLADLSNLIVQLAEKADAQDTDEDLWGQKGFYFAGSGKEMTFGEIATHIAKKAYRENLITSEDVDSISVQEADKLSPHASAIVGTNAREHAQRGQRFLGWKASTTDLEAEISRCVLQEAEKLKSAR